MELIGASDRKWGIDRLRLLVPDELRDRWDRQLLKFEKALRSMMAGDIRRHASGVRAGLQALEAAAIEAGHKSLDPQVWEAPLPDGSVVGIVRSQAENLHIAHDGRYAEVYTVAEVGVALAKFGDAVRVAKRNFPGAEITGSRPPIDWSVGDSIDDLGH